MELSVRTESIRSSVLIRTPFCRWGQPERLFIPGGGRPERRVLVGIMPGIP
jgi:hypothetical protein